MSTRVAAVLVLAMAGWLGGCSSPQVPPAGCCGGGQSGETNCETPVAWKQVPRILARIHPPAIPKREFVVTNFGAESSGAVKCTQAFKDAIAACAKAGGGRVIVPPGTYLTGAIHLVSREELHLQKGAVIKFSTEPKDYLPVVFGRDVAEMMNYSPLIYALEQHDIAVTGEGVLDGQGPAGGWYPWAWNKLAKDATDKMAEWAQAGVPVSQRILGEGYHLRPNLFEPVRCRNVMIQGVTVLDSPMWVLHPLYCTNVIVQGVTVRSHGPNTDGCDPDSCMDVWIKDCVFQTGDDCIAVKSGRDEDGLKIAMPCQNVVIQGCRFADGHGGVTLGSETSGGLRNVFAEDCQFDSPNLDQALRFKTNPARGGFIEGIYLRRCAIQTAKFGIHITMRYGSSGTSTDNAIPRVRNIDIRDCTFANLTKKALFIEGLSEQAQVTDVSIVNCTAEKSASPSTITNAARVNLSGCKGM